MEQLLAFIIAITVLLLALLYLTIKFNSDKPVGCITNCKEILDSVLIPLSASNTSFNASTINQTMTFSDKENEFINDIVGNDGRDGMVVIPQFRALEIENNPRETRTTFVPRTNQTIMSSR